MSPWKIGLKTSRRSQPKRMNVHMYKLKKYSTTKYLPKPWYNKESIWDFNRPNNPPSPASVPCYRSLWKLHRKISYAVEVVQKLHLNVTPCFFVSLQYILLLLDGATKYIIFCLSLLEREMCVIKKLKKWNK